MNLDEFEMKMMKAIDNLEERYVSIRAGRANPSMLNGVMVDFYGTPTPISSIANITVPVIGSLTVPAVIFLSPRPGFCRVSLSRFDVTLDLFLISRRRE